MQIREIQEGDAKAYQLYINHLYKERLPTLYLRESVPAIEELESSIKEDVSSDDAFCVVAEDEGNIVACLHYEAYSRPQLSHSGEFTLTVAKQWRSQGIGTNLVKLLISWVKQHEHITRIEAEVFSNNSEAMSIYKKLGFIQEGVKHNAVLVEGNYIDIIQIAWMES
jgi:RimJ/RimL family protein N-acetyltransferase